MEPIILNKQFQGPFLDYTQLKDTPGVYLVVCESNGMTPVRVLHAAASDNVRENVNTVKKRNFLSKSKVEEMNYLVRYEDNPNERLQLVKDIKKYIHPAI
ncbi:MAG: hypothetical protein JSS63_06210 [Bacteroidetes bacterium]|nr:hypothetical protein [Bacteroidota bacterium]